MKLPEHIQDKPIKEVTYSRTVHFKDGSIHVSQGIKIEDFAKDVIRLLEDYEHEGTFYGNLFYEVMKQAKDLLIKQKEDES